VETPEKLIEALRASSLTAPGVTEPALRRAVYDRAAGAVRGETQSNELPSDLAAFVDSVALHSNDADVDLLLHRGRSEDEIFEVAVVSAVAAGMLRVEEGLRAARDKK
jgi:hypothetical protein